MKDETITIDLKMNKYTVLLFGLVLFWGTVVLIAQNGWIEVRIQENCSCEETYHPYDNDFILGGKIIKTECSVPRDCLGNLNLSGCSRDDCNYCCRNICTVNQCNTEFKSIGGINKYEEKITFQYTNHSEKKWTIKIKEE